MRDTVLVLHILAGTAGLVLGPLAMLAPKRRGRHTRVGTLYFVAMNGVCFSAAVLAVSDWARIWWFLPIAVFSYFWAALGFWAVKRRPLGWLALHVIGQGGSYIALTTALLVVNVGADVPLAWALPTLIGSPLIGRVVARLPAGAAPRTA
jgi:hypothetical protein